MYKGKFSAGASRNHRPDPELDLEKLLAAEKAEAEANAEVAAPEIKAPEKAETPKPDTMPKKKKPGKKIKRHTIVFYSIYLVMIVACVVAVLLLMDPLDDFLNRYEANQPDVQAEKYFNENFKDPDWAALCAASGNDLGGKGTMEDFVAYMDNWVGEQELSYVAVSMGLDRERSKFEVRLGDETVASFILAGKGSGAIKEWVIDEVLVNLPEKAFDKSVTVTTVPGVTVTVGDIVLDDSHVIKTTATHAEDYLPEGLTGPRTVTYYIDGFLAVPAVTAEENGQTVTLEEKDGVYLHATKDNTPTDEQKKAYDKPSQAYGKFMIAALGKQALSRYFTGESYDAITQAELAWMQDYASYEFGDLELTEFYAYSDSWTSARVKRILYVTRGNGTVKEYEINSTFFMEKQEGQWMVVQLTNADVQKGTAQVRLRFFKGGSQLDSQLLAADTEMIEPPTVEVPEGKKLVWCTRSVDAEGKVTMTPVFEVNKFGEIFLPNGYKLEPMDLHAQFVEG